MFPFGGAIKCTKLSTILNEPLCNLATSLAEWVVAGFPNTPLSTLTTGRVAIPAATSSASLIKPSETLAKPTCVTVMNSSLIFNKSLGWIELIPDRTNWVKPTPILESNVWLIDVKDTGCWTTPSNPIIVLDNDFAMLNLWELPPPVDTKVNGVPPLVADNLKLFSSINIQKTFDGKSVPGVVCIAVPATPMKEESGL